MSTRSLTIFGLSLGILAACGGPATVTYRLTFDSTDPGTIEELTNATLRVAERRLDRMKATVEDSTITKDEAGVTLELKVSDAASAETLTAELTTPFDLHIMVATTDVANADVTVEGFGAFNETGVTGDDLVNIIASADPATNGGIIRINFTTEGLVKMRALFQNNVGNDLGLFVRGRLVSALTVASADMPNPLVIDGIPDAELARVFADDVNVGTHVTVTPL